MPVHMTPLTRRRFLSYSLAAGAGVLTLRNVPAAEAGRAKIDPDAFALVSDTHIPAKASIAIRGVNMTANLKKIVGELVSAATRPAGVIVSGDCAYSTGLAGDYAALAGLLAPLARAGMPVHLAMGNHDHRGRFYEQFKARKAKAKAVQGKHVSVVESARANWFILDSLWQTNVVTGVLGAVQLAWLAKALDAKKDKPAIVVAHHNPVPAKSRVRKITGLRDTAALFEVLAARAHVKAYVYGHTHTWKLAQQKGLHLVNLPTSAYTFGRGKTNGWVHAQLGDGGMTLRHHCHDPKHARHGKEFKLTWRADKA